MSVVAAIRDLLAKGFTVEQALVAAEAFEPVRPVRSAAAERQARYRANGGDKIPFELREEVFERDGFACVYCGSEEYLQCDHVVPVSKGGVTSLENLATACRVCNAKKKDRDRKAFLRDLRKSTELPRNSKEGAETPLSPPPPKNTNQTPSTPNPETKRAKRRTAMTADQQPSKSDGQAGIDEGLSRDEFRAEWQAFRDFHISKGNVMADWSAAWRTWLRNRKRFGKPPRSPPKSSRPTIADRYANLINDEPDHDEPTHDGPTIDGSCAASGDDPRGRYATAQPLEPLGAEPGWPLAATGYAGNHN